MNFQDVWQQWPQGLKLTLSGQCAPVILRCITHSEIFSDRFFEDLGRWRRCHSQSQVGWRPRHPVSKFEQWAYVYCMNELALVQAGRGLHLVENLVIRLAWRTQVGRVDCPRSETLQDKVVDQGRNLVTRSRGEQGCNWVLDNRQDKRQENESDNA